MKVIFQTPKLDVRGTCVALYDYAHYNETLLGNKSVIAVPEGADDNPDVIRKFSNRFEIIRYTDIPDLERKVDDGDVLYTIKYGHRNETVSDKFWTVVHCVFDLSQPHGDVYAAVSKQLAAKFGWDKFVPHMIGMRPSRTGENLRAELSIPETARVFGRHGGMDTFDLEIAMRAIHRVLQDCPDTHFVFVNTCRFTNHPRVHYLPKIVDLDEKNRFINTCDAMIHAQSLGETFGISIGEFSVNNKPVVTYGGPVMNDNYKEILKDKAIYYHNEQECYSILKDFRKEDYTNRDINCYKDYTPEVVMKIFDEVFLQPKLRSVH